MNVSTSVLKFSAWATKGKSFLDSVDHPSLGHLASQKVSLSEDTWTNRALTVHPLQLQKYFLYENTIHLCICEPAHSCFMDGYTLLSFFEYLNSKCQGAQLHQSFYLTSVQNSSLLPCW